MFRLIMLWCFLTLLPISMQAEVNTVKIPDPAKMAPASKPIPVRKKQPAKDVPIPSFYHPFAGMIDASLGVIRGVSFVAGLFLLVIAAIRFVKYYYNPQEYTFSNAMGMVMFAVVLFVIAYLPEPKISRPKQSNKVNASNVSSARTVKNTLSM